MDSISDYVYSYVYQVKLIPNQTLCSGFDKQLTKPNDPKFMLLMFRFQILEPELTSPAEHLACSLMEKLFDFELIQQTQDRELNKYPFFEIEPVSDTLKHEMLEKITEFANEALLEAKNDPSNRKQICLILTVKGRKPPGDDEYDDVTGQPSRDKDAVVTGQPCVVCWDEFENINGVIKLNCECNHLYHDACIWKWLKQNHTCPTCRFNFALSRENFVVPISKWLPQFRKMKRTCSSPTRESEGDSSARTV